MEGGRRVKAGSIGHLHQGERRLRCRECLQHPKPVYQRLGNPCAIGVYCHGCVVRNANNYSLSEYYVKEFPMSNVFCSAKCLEPKSRRRGGNFTRNGLERLTVQVGC